MPQTTLTDGDRAAHVFGILRNLETKLFEVDVEAVARSAKDDDITTQDGTSTFAEYRKGLDAQVKRLRKDFADLMPEVDALAAAQHAREAQERAARADQVKAQQQAQ